MKFDSHLMFTEEELLQLTQRLIHLFATLQKVNVAHRNIKPANLVFSQQPSKHKSNQMSFDQLLICNFEMATCFHADSHYSEHLCQQEQQCSAIYSSPLVQSKVQVLTERDISNIVVEVAANQEESFVGDVNDVKEIPDNHYQNKINWAKRNFNPFVEDVFSVGLTILQTAYSC